MQKQTRIRVTDIVGQLIDEEAIRDPRATAKQILLKVRGRLNRVNNDDPLPDERSIQKRGNRARALNPDAANLWSLNMSGKQTPAEALPDLLQVWHVAKTADVPFTLRPAQWAAAIRFQVRGSSLGPIKWSDAEKLLEWSYWYAEREYTSEKNGDPINTADLDAELAFQPEVSSLHQWWYGQAIRLKVIPPSSAFAGWELSPFSPIYEDARHFLSQVDQDCDIKGWYPVGLSVTKFWLKEIAENSPRWQLVFSSRVNSADQKSWNEMGVQLAKEVMQKAKEVNQLGARESENKSDGDLSWEPRETLIAAGLSKVGGAI